MTLTNKPHHAETLAEISSIIAQDPSASVWLSINASTTEEQLRALSGSDTMEHVRVLEIDTTPHRLEVARFLESARTSNLDSIIIGEYPWGEHDLHGRWAGWEPGALSPGLDAIFARCSPRRVVWRGSLPKEGGDEFGGPFAFVEISDWWRSVRVLELATYSLEDDTLTTRATFVTGLSALEALIIKSPYLTDEAAEFLSRNDFNYRASQRPSPNDTKPPVTLTLESPLITTEGWRLLAHNEMLEPASREVFARRANAPAKSWNERFGELRVLLDVPTLTGSRLNSIGHYLSSINALDPKRYDDEIAPYVRDAIAALSTEPVQAQIEWLEDLEALESTCELIPGLELDVENTEWGDELWPELYDSPILPIIRGFEGTIRFDEGMERLSRSAEELDDLRRLKLYGYLSGAEHWLTFHDFTNLTSLDFYEDNEATSLDVVIDALCTPNKFGALRRLRLGGGCVSSEALERFAASALASLLDTIDLADINGVHASANATNLSDSAKASWGIKVVSED